MTPSIGFGTLYLKIKLENTHSMEAGNWVQSQSPESKEFLVSIVPTSANKAVMWSALAPDHWKSKHVK